jgi:hypothetical protein
MADCPVCRESLIYGVLIVESIKLPLGHSLNTYVICDTCDGSGKLPQEAPTRVELFHMAGGKAE